MTDDLQKLLTRIEALERQNWRLKAWLIIVAGLALAGIALSCTPRSHQQPVKAAERAPERVQAVSSSNVSIVRIGTWEAATVSSGDGLEITVRRTE